MAEDENPAVARLGSRDPGEDPDDPYEGVDVSDLPEWWRRAIAEFEDHDLRAYRPPRLADGTPLHEAVEGIERDCGVEVAFGSVDSDFRERWEIRVDGDRAGTVGRHRSVEGYTVYETDEAGLRDLIADAVD